MPDTTEPLVERDWTFCHRYITANGQVAAMWLDHNGDERHYRDVPRHATPGTVWTMRCTATGSSAAPKSATYTGRRAANEDDLVRWRALDHAAKIEKERATALRKLAAVENLDTMTISDVRDALLHTRTYKDRAALIALVLCRLGVM